MAAMLCALAFLASARATSAAVATELISIATDGQPGDSISLFPAISSDGRYVVFTSYAKRLVDGYDNQYPNIFLRDRALGTTFQASLTAAGGQPNGDCLLPAVSDDGRFVAFESFASNLIDGPLVAFSHIFLRDRTAGTTVLGSVRTTGAPSDSFSISPELSADGSVVVFEYQGDTLVPGGSGGVPGIYARDLSTGTTTRVSADSDGVDANAGSTRPSLSKDGRFVAFWSLASNLVAGDTNAIDDVFVHDRTTGVTERVSVASGGVELTGGSSFPAISASGRFVAFASVATDAVAGDTNGVGDVFVHDRLSHKTTRASVTAAGGEANGASSLPSISADGRFVAFESDASNLVVDDGNAAPDHFVRDRFTGTTVRVSVATDGTEANYGANGQPRLSADGRFVAFQSYATTLVPGTGGYTNIYVRGIDTAVALCVPHPAENCRPTLRPASSWLTIRRAPVGSRRGPQLQWKGAQGAATPVADFGMPTADTQYAICVYAADAPILQARVAPGTDCALGGCWKSLGGRGFSYRGSADASEGVTAIRLRAGDERRASAVVKAHGEHLTLPALPLELPLVVQLQAGHGQCWEATYSRHVVFNDANLFKARAE